MSPPGVKSLPFPKNSCQQFFCNRSGLLSHSINSLQRQKKGVIEVAFGEMQYQFIAAQHKLGVRQAFGL